MHAPSEFSKILLTCSAASSCNTAFFRAFYLRGCESLPLGTEVQTSNTKNTLDGVRKQCSVVDVPMCWWLYRAGEGRDGGEGCCRAQSVAALKTDF